MGTILRIRACNAERAASAQAIEAAFREASRLEGVLSSWREDTEIGRINGAAPGALLRIKPELAALLAEAGTWVEATGGAFDPAIGPLITIWGYRGQPRVPDANELKTALRSVGWKFVRLRGDTIQRGPAGWWLDTGGFGKGAAIRAMAEIIRAHGTTDFTIDFGGQLLLAGDSQTIAVANPSKRSEPVLSLRLAGVSVSTSSQSEHFFKSGKRRYGHILDPRTGSPVPAWGSVTVVSPDALAADALSTALFVMGPAAALRWGKEHPDVGVLIIITNKSEGLIYDQANLCRAVIHRRIRAARDCAAGHVAN